MKKILSEILDQNCLYKTERISVQKWNYIASKISPTKAVLKIMTPNVTKALPDGWQNIDTHNKAEHWINSRKADSSFYVISLIDANEIIGFLFLYNSEEKNELCELRLGYILSESHWGKGIGSELIRGLLQWCRESEIIKSISGGVEKDNIGSIKVLEKNGFYKSNEELPGGMLLYKINFN